jgi:3-methylcrotonyl-CoA carboxylase alpha subunit
MRALGGKAAAKEIAIKAGVPVVPGDAGRDQSPSALAKAAAGIGYPVMIKAVAGGGGRGMRLVTDPADFAASLESAKREAAGAFGNDHVLIEKVVVAPRHIEVQVFGDRHGNAVHLFERDCSLQRRNQKVIEEAPAPGMSAELRRQITTAAVKLAKSVGYEGAGTIEFLVEGGSLGPQAPWYFIEMNTRLQVEHPVTEAITGLDLVEWQLRIASGEPIPLAQDKISMCGHAIEARLCAEDPSKGFMPSIGRIADLVLPTGDGVRCDFGPEPGNSVSPFYDSMIGKVIAFGSDRSEAIRRLRGALAATGVLGLETNVRFLDSLLANGDVTAGRMDTGLIGREIDGLTQRPSRDMAIARGAFQLLSARASAGAGDPWAAADGFQLGPPRQLAYTLTCDGAPVTVTVRSGSKGLEVLYGQGCAAEEFDSAIVRLDGPRALVVRDMTHSEIAWPSHDLDALDDGDGSGAVRAPINGRVAKLFVRDGEAVDKGARVAVVEAMKMEHLLVAPRAGRIEKIAVAEGAQVTQRTLIATIAD